MSQAYLRFPCLHGDHLVFVSDDDLWRYDLQTQRCHRLTQGIGAVSHPTFSPDGSSLAFTCAHEGAHEVYLMPAQGGDIVRLTFLGDQAQVCGWRDSDSIVFASSHTSAFRQNHLFTISKEGGIPVALDIGPANSISFGAQSGAMVIQRHGYGYPSWKRYQGGLAAELWIKTKKSEAFSLLAKTPYNTLSPQWHGERIYYLSDHQDHGNVYSCLPDGCDNRRHTHHQGLYVRQMSIWQNTLVYSCGGDIWISDLQKNSAAKRLPIALNHYSTHRARKFIHDGYRLESACLSHDGKHIAFSNRGRLFTMPTWAGGSKSLGKNHGVRYRLTTWLHSKKLAAICDEGKKDIIVTSQPYGHGQLTRWSDFDFGRVLDMVACPTQDLLLLTNHRHELHLFDMASSTLTLVDTCAHANFSGLDWSPDGKWITYGKPNSHDTAAIILYDLASKTKTLVTSGQYADYSPCFDPDGKYLYFLSQRHLSPKMDEVCFRYSFSNTSIAFVCCLQEDSPDPLFPGHESSPAEDEEDDDSGKDDSKSAEDNSSGNKKDEEKKKDAVKPVVIDLKDISSRIKKVPVSPGRYTDLCALSQKLLLVTASWHDDQADDDARAGVVTCYDFKDHKSEELFDSVSQISLSSDRNWLLKYHKNRLRVIPAGAKPDDKDDSYKKGGWIDLKRASLQVQPQQEWLFMFTEAWRLQQDFFWDKDMGQLDWDAVYNTYLPVAKKVNTRAELSDVISEMQGELGSSHAYVWGGDAPYGTFFPQGFLGGDFAFDTASKHWQLTAIHTAEPGIEAFQSPLTTPGVNMQIGDLLIAINGHPVDAKTTPESLLVHQANSYVTLTVSKGKGAKSRDITVKTLASTKRLHYRAWVENNRRIVHDKSQGKLGYIHIPDMSKQGYAEFTRSYLQCFDCEGLVIDVRFNGGGNVSSLILQKLALKRFGLDSVRWLGSNLSYPIASPRGSMVAICNEQAGSDGDMFSHAFKAMKLGPLVGKRTWGGVIGINVRNSLLDGGMTSQPEYAVWFDGVGYGIENHGVDPDEIIEISPEQAAKGQDPQLDRAIEIALAQITNLAYPDLDQRLDATPKPNLNPKPLPEAVGDG